MKKLLTDAFGWLIFGVTILLIAAILLFLPILIALALISAIL